MFRLILVFLLLLLSLLCVFRAPEYHLWYMAILVTEFPWIFMLLSLLTTVWALNSDRYKGLTVTLSIISFVLFSSPVVRAYMVAAKLDKDFDAAFVNTQKPAGARFNFLQMFTGLNAPQIAPRSLVYDADKKLSLDYYPAQFKGQRPCVIVVHGGSWAGGDNKQLPELNTYLANKGYHVVALNYRLAPQYLSPTPIDDIQTAMAYLAKHEEELKIDTNQYVLLGRSAGAQIVLCAAYTLKAPNIKGVINFYGPADMVWGYSLPANPLVFDSRKVMIDYLGGTYEQVPQQYVNSSATELATEGSPPTLSIHGILDPLVAYEHSPRLDKKLKAHHVPHYLLTLPWATHGCDYTLNGPSGQLSTYAVERFLKVVVK